MHQNGFEPGTVNELEATGEEFVRFCRLSYAVGRDRHVLADVGLRERGRQARWVACAVRHRAVVSDRPRE